MDGRLQSSDEEYDSRADTISAFMTTGPISTPPVFDPLYQNSNTTPFLNSTWPMPTTLDTNMINNNPMYPTPPSNLNPSFRLNDNNNNDDDNLSPALLPQGQKATARNSKKRSRASRRAPTTVLTTDTNNFRAMVQEFTGIPAPPFNNNSPFPRTRLGTRSFTSSFEAAPSYLRRPFAQKVQSSPPPSITTLVTSGVVSSTNPASSVVNSSSAPTINYQQSLNLFNNIPNPLANPLLQTNPRFPFSNFIKPQQGSSFGNLGFDGFGNNMGPTLSGLPDLISSDQNEHNKDCNNRNVGNYGVSMMSTSGEKGPENVISSGRGEGMVESWICSSD